MGACLSAANTQWEKVQQDRLRQRVSDSIDRDLKVEEKRLKKECTILLLGKTYRQINLCLKTNVSLILVHFVYHVQFHVHVNNIGNEGSGASTLLRHMKMIHQGGYNREELETLKLNVYRNLVDSARSLIMAMEKMGVQPSKPENKEHVDKILEYRVGADPSFKLNPTIAKAIDSLYHDPITATCMEKSIELGIEDIAP